MIARGRSLGIAVLPLFAVALAGCPKKGGAGADGGTDAAAVAVADAAPAVDMTPTNEASVARFGDETKLADVEAKIADARVNARNSVPGGTVVAGLKQGTAVTEIAQHGKFILVVFEDPKDATKKLEGWVGEEAFKAGPTTPPAKGGCTGKQVHLVVDDQFFCGDVCKEDKDCPHAEKCTGHAHTYVDGKEGPEVTTCTVTSEGDAGGAPSSGGAKAAGPTIKDVQEPPGADGKCAAGYAMATDKMCHKTCPAGPKDCPNAQSRCTAKATADGTGVCVSTAK